MADINNLVKIAIDGYKGNVGQYSVDQSQELLRQALIEANGGSTTINYKMIRDGKCGAVFTIIEEILSRVIVEGLQGDEFFNALVDFRNVAEGDKNLFIVEDATLFVVADAADGTQAIRRQRLGESTEVSVPTSLKVVRIYEELNRILAGRADFNYLIKKVADSFRKRLLDDIYTLWTTASADQFGDIVYFPEAGAYDEDELLDLVSHVEAAAGGKQATIIGTKKAIRNLRESIQSDAAKDELHTMGYYGTFYGTPVVMVPQRHKTNSTEFIMNDNILTIIAGDDKPIKCVYEGDPLVYLNNPFDNQDLTQEYFYAEKYGLGIVLAGGNAGIGRYDMTITEDGD